MTLSILSTFEASKTVLGDQNVPNMMCGEGQLGNAMAAVLVLLNDHEAVRRAYDSEIGAVRIGVTHLPEGVAYLLAYTLSSKGLCSYMSKDDDGRLEIRCPIVI